jgi:proline iminopeptidase
MESKAAQQTRPVDEGIVAIGGVDFFCRVAGRGRPVIVLHGGPDFDHIYLLPDMDRLADTYRLIYYDQRGRGRSAPDTQPDDVTMATEVADLDAVRAHFGLESVVLLGHSWGGLLAMAYAVAHPQRISHLILMNTAPASHEGYLALRTHITTLRAPLQDAFAALRASAAYQAGDPDATAEYCRLHFSTTVRHADELERLVGQLRASFTPEIVLRSRAIEERLYEDTWLRPDFDLLPALHRLSMPALVLHSEHDLIPTPIAARIAEAIPGARLTVLPDCGHFAYMEAPDAVRRELAAFLPPEE